MSTTPALIKANFAKLNKNDTIEEYQYEVDRGEYYVEDCHVVEVVVLTAAEYDEFTHSFLTDRDWLAGKGGTGSTADLPEVKSFFDYTEEQREEFKRHAYNEVVAVQGPDGQRIFVDPQGHDYARYVGLPIEEN